MLFSSILVGHGLDRRGLVALARLAGEVAATAQALRRSLLAALALVLALLLALLLVLSSLLLLFQEVSKIVVDLGFLAFGRS